MDSSDVKELVEDMSGSIDDLEASLAPLLNATLSSSTSKLPLLDKAKLYVLATYAIDSVLFSYIRLNGKNVKDHPVVQEIMRVRSYFNKIKEVEAGPVQRNTTLDKDAAARFIKHGLAGNDKYDQARQDRKAIEAGAKRKAEEFEASARFGSQNRFAGMAKRMKAEEGSITVVKADDATSDEEATPDSKAERKAAKHQRRAERAKAKESAVDGETQEEGSAAASTETGGKKRTAPRSNHETFQALLNGPTPKKEKKKRKTRGEAQQALEDKRAQEMM
jgi:exosome complex protein LRP1